MISLEHYLLMALATFSMNFAIYWTLSDSPRMTSIIGMGIVALVWPLLLCICLLNGLIHGTKNAIEKEQS